MYPNLYYVFKSWFGVDWKFLAFLNTFGLMVAIGFVVSSVVIYQEFRRKEKQGLLFPREETITVGKPASIYELLINFLSGFLFGYKLLGLFLNKPVDLSPQEYIFSRDGNLLGGLTLGLLLALQKWSEKNKQKLKEPESRVIRIWPHDRVGDIVITALVFGVLGAKLFDNFENWDDFISHPIQRIFSASGLTFYGGLIVAAIAIGWYAVKKGINLTHLLDVLAPAMMIGYAVGRIGCQVAGDGDWGIYNSAYITNENAKVVLAKPGDYEKQLQKYHTYFIEGAVIDSTGLVQYVTDRKNNSLTEVPHISMKAPSFIPTWMVAYNYPNNVNKDGILIPNCNEEHARALPMPVFPTPFYETVVCALMFAGLWAIRKKLKTPGLMTGIYLCLNGIERFAVEKIRVNNQYHIGGFHPTQAEIISLSLIIAGLSYILIIKLKKPQTA